MAEEAESVIDALLGGKLLLRQPARGHRAGTDAILLAAAATPTAGRVIDLGAGVGTAGLAVAMRNPQANVLLAERDAWIAELAAENIRLNGLEGRASVAVADILSASARRQACLPDAEADLAICNPPFYDAGEVRISPQARKAAAHVAEGDGAGIDGWMRAIAALLRPGGRFVLIHRPDALGLILAAADGRFGALAIRPIHPKADSAAVRVLVSGLKGSRAPLSILPGFVLHETDGQFTREAEAVHRGEASISWI